jgi:transcriptional regulator with XRE-family HTH domain
MLQAVSLPPPTEPSQAPARIVMGVYLRGLREAQGKTLEDAARVVRASVSAVSRWERAESLLQPYALEQLLRNYGVLGKHADYLVRQLPPRSYSRDKHEEKGLARRAPFDHWADVAAEEAMARYVAVTRTASDLLQYTMAIPPGLRTQAYSTAALDLSWCLNPDEPVIGMPRWVHGVKWAEGQRRTVLLDETVLIRPVGGPEVMAGQLRYLAARMSGEVPGRQPVTIRVLPTSPARGFHTLGEPAEVTINGYRLVTGFSLSPSYETGSGYAHVVSAGLREAESDAHGHEESYDLILRAADAMERRAAS